MRTSVLGYATGLVYARGKGVAPDRKRAAERYKKACDAGSAQGCAGLRELEAGAGGATPEEKEKK
jgi:TPR repeat protein